MENEYVVTLRFRTKEIVAHLPDRTTTLRPNDVLTVELKYDGYPVSRVWNLKFESSWVPDPGFLPR